jgi:hypothetical protein
VKLLVAPDDPIILKVNREWPPGGESHPNSRSLAGLSLNRIDAALTSFTTNFAFDLVCERLQFSKAESKFVGPDFRHCWSESQRNFAQCDRMRGRVSE